MSEESGTPRTDDEPKWDSMIGWCVSADFARQLERGLAAVTAERDEANKRRNEVVAKLLQMEKEYGRLCREMNPLCNERDEAISRGGALRIEATRLMEENKLLRGRLADALIYSPTHLWQGLCPSHKGDSFRDCDCPACIELMALEAER